MSSIRTSSDSPPSHVINQKQTVSLQEELLMPDIDPRELSPYSYHSSRLSFFNPRGRIGRMRFFCWYQGLSLLSVLVGCIWFFLRGYLKSDMSFIIPESDISVTIFILLHVVFVIVILIQRLHDLDVSAWWCLPFTLLYLPPDRVNVPSFILIFILLFLLCLIFGPGTNGDNRYGAPPPKNSLGVKIFFWFNMIIIACGLLVGFIRMFLA